MILGLNNKGTALGDCFADEKYYYRRRRIFNNNVMMGYVGAIDETYVMTREVHKRLFNLTLAQMTVFDGIRIPYFLLYFSYIVKTLNTSSNKNLDIILIPPSGILGIHPVTMPPIDEQRRIVEHLKNLLRNMHNAKGLVKTREAL